MNVKRLIVGVDPGLNCGLAVLTLDGFPLLIDSRREWTFSNLIQTITELGEPTIVSSDVSPASELIDDLSKKLNAVLFTPLISLGTNEKHELARLYTERYEVKAKNIHEVDALAAAVKAYQHYKNKFEQVEAKIKRQGLKVSVDDVKDLVVRGYTLNRAVQTLLSSGEAKASTIIRRVISQEEKMKSFIEELKERIILEKEKSKRLKMANRDLRLKIKTLETEISSLKRKNEEIKNEQIAQIRREREYQLLLDEVKMLRRKITECSKQIEDYRQRFEQLQRLKELESQGKLALLKPVESFTKDGLEKSFKLYEVKTGDFILLLDPSGGGAATAESLAKRGVKAVVTRGVMSYQAMEVFAKYMIPVIPCEKLAIEWIEGLPYVDSESLRKAVKEVKESEYWRALEELKTIVEDHRKELKDGET